MSDLQCPARFLVLGSPDATSAAGLRHERVAAVYDGAAAAVGTVGGLSSALGLPLEPLGDPLALADVLAGREAALAVLRELADLHRGETVVVAAVGDAGRRVDVAVDGDGVTVSEPPG